jgi:adenylate kinase family enzyme
MRRVAVVGCSGAGKTTLARSLSARLGVPHVELDALFHLPGWSERPAEEFRVAVAAALAGDGWVVDGNYTSRLGDVTLGAADTVVWLDFSRPVVMSRIVTRSVRRVVTREELWNGNRETWSNLVSRDPKRSIIAWAWTQHGPYRRQYEAGSDPSWVRLRTPVDARRWLAAIPAGALS